MEDVYMFGAGILFAMVSNVLFGLAMMLMEGARYFWKKRKGLTKQNE